MMFVKPTLNSTLLALLIGLHLMAFSGTPLDASTSHASKNNILTDFTTSTTDMGWYVQDDGVMGGLSKGSFKSANGTLTFTGFTNTNGGGFSSIRTQRFNLDLSGFEGIRLKVKGDGRRYSWQLQTDATWRGRPVSYWADFDTQASEWITVDIPFTNFKPQFRGMRLDGPELEPAQLSSMSLYIYDKQDGAFEFYLDSVSAY